MSAEQESASGSFSSDDEVVPLSEESLSLECSAEEVGALLEAFRPYLLAIANTEFPRSLASKFGPSDLVQLTLAKGFGEYQNFRGTTRSELAQWLRSILRNYLKQEVRGYRRQSRNVLREQPVNEEVANNRQLSASAEMRDREERERVSRAMDQLPELYRKAIELRHIENLSFVEVGRRLNRSEDAARKVWARAVRTLQKELGDDAC